MKKQAKQTLIFVILITVAAGAALWRIDAKNSKDNPNDEVRKKSEVKAKAWAEREYIKVDYLKLQELVASIRDKHSSYSELGMPISMSDTMVQINVEKLTDGAIQDIIGSNENTERWSNCYSVKNNLHFKASYVDSVLVVDCPAYILAKFVGLAESK